MRKLLKKASSATLTVGAVFYIGVLGLLYWGQRDLLYHPTTIVPNPAQSGVPEMTARRLTTAEGYRPLIWWSPPANGVEPVVIYFHGNYGHIGTRAVRARDFIDAGYGVLLAGYRYNSGAGGEPSEEGLIADARAALEFVRSEGITGHRIVLYGESLGTGVAVALATENDIGALVLEMPYTSIGDVAQDIYWYLPAKWLVRDNFDSLARIRNVRAPVLVIHGENDNVIPVRFGRQLFEAAPDPKEGHFLPGGTHGNLYRLGAGSIVMDFLGRHVVACR